MSLKVYEFIFVGCTEEDEIVQLLAKSSHFRESKKLVEEYMGRAYIFKLDNVDYLYRIQDLQLPNTDLLSNTVRVEITEFRSLNSIIAAPLGGPFDEMRSGLSGRIGRWMSLRNKQQRKDLVTTVVPEYEQVLFYAYKIQYIVHIRKRKHDNCLAVNVFRNNYLDVSSSMAILGDFFL